MSVTIMIGRNVLVRIGEKLANRISQRDCLLLFLPVLKDLDFHIVVTSIVILLKPRHLKWTLSVTLITHTIPYTGIDILKRLISNFDPAVLLTVA